MAKNHIFKIILLVATVVLAALQGVVEMEEDILVIGTPYHAPFLYKLVAHSIGLDFDEDEEMTMQIVEHNGYRFLFNTFADENLRSVQFWMIESELEQAIGRARLLRHDCTVHLFSNFPLKQSEMVTEFDYTCCQDTH